MKLNLFLVTIAPLLSIADAVAGAPANAAAVVERSLPQHRREVLDARDEHWHRLADRQVDVPTDPSNSTTPDGPPTVITVSADPTDSSTSTDPASTTDTSSDTNRSTDPPTTTSSTEEVIVTTTEAPPLISLSLSLPPLIPDPTTDTPTTSDTPTPTPDPTPTTTDGPLISLSLSVDNPITDPPVDPPTSSSSTTDPPPQETPPTDTTSSTISVPQDPDPPISNSVTITISSSTSGGVLDPTDVFPTQTVSNPSITTTIIDSTSRPPITIDSDYEFLSATTFVLAPDAANTTSTSLTITDPDAVVTPTTIPTEGAATTLTMPAIPSSIPMFITPPPSTDPVDADSSIDGYTKIGILFQKSSVPWTWLLSSSETAGQILAYLPPHLQQVLELASDQVKVVGLQAFVPSDYHTESDLMTIFIAFLPNEDVATLASMIRTLTSPFYETNDPVAKEIAKNVVASYDITSLEGVNNENGSTNPTNSTTTKADNSRRNAIIGVSVTFGLIAVIVLIWWGVRTYRNRQEGMHKRLSYGGTTTYGATGGGMTQVGGYTAARADSPPMLHNPFMTEHEREEAARGIRRNSFYAIGPDDASIEEETFDYLSHRNSAYSGGAMSGGMGAGYGGNGGGATGLNRSGSGGSGGARWLGPPGGGSNQGHGQRRLVVGQPISQPILRESSMGNW